jgi:hypothetical protein
MAVTGGIAQYGYNPEILGTVSALGPTAIKANRRLFVGNLPDGMKEVFKLGYHPYVLYSNTVF